MKRTSLVLTACLLAVLTIVPLHATAQAISSSNDTPLYLNPLPNAQFVSPSTTLAVRPGGILKEADLRAVDYKVVGGKSGPHVGAVTLSDDRQTIIFTPAQPFTAGETVSVSIGSGLPAAAGQPLGAISYEFTIAANQRPVTQRDLQNLLAAEVPASEQAGARGGAQAGALASPPARSFLTLPGAKPTITVTVPANGTDAGYLFVAPAGTYPVNSPYFGIFDNTGQPVYFNGDGKFRFDFKKQAPNLLTYYETDRYYAMDNTYTVVDQYKMGHGYYTDPHDMQLLPNGHALMIGLDFQIMDLSHIVPGGQVKANVAGAIIQEIDTAKQVVFEWRSWDHFQITDSQIDLTTPAVDYVHPNAIAFDTDGNILLSSRHMSEITKINRQTGAIIWRLGGKNNQFTFIGDTAPYFHFQHDIRRIANGDITLFDNRTYLTPSYSRAVEYRLDETAKTAQLVWQYRHTPDVYALATGNTQRLPNSNTLITWGLTSLVTEVKPDNSTAWEAQFPPSNYRVFRFPWQATPAAGPVLVQRTTGLMTTLTVSWNGATDIGSYKVYGGLAPHPTTLLTTQPRTGFETQATVPYVAGQCNYFQVMPVNTSGQDTRLTNEVTVCLQFLILVRR